MTIVRPEANGGTIFRVAIPIGKTCGVIKKQRSTGCCDTDQATRALVVRVLAHWDPSRLLGDPAQKLAAVRDRGPRRAAYPSRLSRAGRGSPCTPAAGRTPDGGSPSLAGGAAVNVECIDNSIHGRLAVFGTRFVAGSTTCNLGPAVAALPQCRADSTR
jgi:hypothetical protein